MAARVLLLEVMSPTVAEGGGEYVELQGCGPGLRLAGSGSEPLKISDPTFNKKTGPDQDYSP